ncbi:MAG: hypothetical protein NXI02_31870 [Rhodobacteraceae bacterium]|nr:hypothetical protein [Paracoccaceae bacterium]
MIYIGQEKLSFKQALGIYSKVLYSGLPKPIGMSNKGHKNNLGKRMSVEGKGLILRNTGATSFIVVG